MKMNRIITYLFRKGYLRKYRYWNAWLHRVRYDGYVDYDEEHNRTFNVAITFIGLTLSNKVLYHEIVPLWAIIQFQTIGASSWKSSFPQWCFKYKNK